MATLNDLFKVLDAKTLTALADDDGDGAPDTGVLEYALSAADSEARMAFDAAGYTTDAEPLFLADLILSLAAARLFERKTELIPETWIIRTARARETLDRIASGKLPLPGLPRTSDSILDTREGEQPTRNALNP